VPKVGDSSRTGEYVGSSPSIPTIFRCEDKEYESPPLVEDI
jgi:hypothetical protein